MFHHASLSNTLLDSSSILKNLTFSLTQLHHCLGCPLGLVPFGFHVMTLLTRLHIPSSTLYTRFVQLGLKLFRTPTVRGSLNISLNFTLVLRLHSLFSMFFLEPNILLNIFLSNIINLNILLLDTCMLRDLELKYLLYFFTFCSV